MKPQHSHETISPETGRFSIFCAGREALVTTATRVLAQGRDWHTLYLCGNYPTVLPLLDRTSRIFHVRRALNPWQVFEILDTSSHSLLIYEHDPAILDDAPEMAAYIGEKCREYAHTEPAAVLLLARKYDDHIRAMEPCADKIISVEYDTKLVPMTKRRTQAAPVPRTQTTLADGWTG